MTLGGFGAFGTLGGEGGAIMCVCFKADASDYWEVALARSASRRFRT